MLHLRSVPWLANSYNYSRLRHLPVPLRYSYSIGWTLEEETDKAEVVAAFGGTQFIQFRAAIAI